VTALIVMGLVVALGVIAYLALMVFARRTAPLDTEQEERWFVVHAPAPLRRALRYADRRVVGGGALVFLFIVVLIAAMSVGWIFDTIDEDRGFARFDEAAAEFGAEHETGWSTKALEAITQLGATGWLLIVMLVIGVVEAWRHRRLAVLGYFAAVVLGVSLLNNALKHLVQRERPAVLQLTSFGSYSFPSGHTAAAAACWAAMALVIARRWPRPARRLAAAVALGITLAVAASRVLLGVHWLTDVIAGAITGWAWFLLVTVLFGGRILRFGEPAERIADDKVTPAPEDRQELETPA
jgi:membrane-associated phospholipid phosphatase